MTVNRVDMKTGDSVAVYKRCAEEQECNIDNIGCYESPIPGVLVSNLFLLAYTNETKYLTQNCFPILLPKFYWLFTCIYRNARRAATTITATSLFPSTPPQHSSFPVTTSRPAPPIRQARY